MELNGEKIAGTTDEIIDTLEKMGMVERSRGLNDDTTEMAPAVEANGHKKLQSAIQKVSKAKKGEKFFGVLKKVRKMLFCIKYYVFAICRLFLKKTLVCSLKKCWDGM